MESHEISEILDGAEASVTAGDGLSGTGFWGAVAQIKGDPQLVETFADRVAEIDRAAFRAWPLVCLPIGVGTALLLFGLVAGLVLVGLAYPAEGLLAVVVFYAGLVAILAVTHGLGHLLVGRVSGIRFTHWFIGTLRQPQPGVKVDYASYLRTPARRRAWMHAAGAITTKVVPFALIGAALAADLPVWSVWTLVGLGGAMIVTDVLWSTKSSDWKKFLREMAFIR